MTGDVGAFLLFFLGLGLYLLWSAKTEMGTKHLQSHKDDRHE